MPDFPKIKSRRTIDVSPWMKIIEREVAFTDGGKPELYHAVDQADYIAIVAMTPEGLIPIVRQYRPAVEGFTWELPAGMTDPGEEPAETCRRELLEETALPARAVHALGAFAPCTARLSNRVHSFFVETGPRQVDQPGEAGIEVELVSPAELAGLIRAGTFTLHLHIGALMLAGMQGFLDFRAFKAP
jgi:8-oxo-dGTP pyrophosphatase MutT (NUDIX family)